MPTDKTNKTLGLLALAGLTPYEEKKGEEYMNEKQMEHFRLLLRAWRNFWMIYDTTDTFR